AFVKAVRDYLERRQAFEACSSFGVVRSGRERALLYVERPRAGDRAVPAADQPLQETLLRGGDERCRRRLNFRSAESASTARCCRSRTTAGTERRSRTRRGSAPTPSADSTSGSTTARSASAARSARATSSRPTRRPSRRRGRRGAETGCLTCDLQRPVVGTFGA